MALSKLLSSNGIKIVGSAPDAINALRMNLLIRPKIAVIDILLKDGPNGIELAQELRKVNSRIGLVFLTTVDDMRAFGEDITNLPPGSLYLNKADIINVEQIQDAIRWALNSFNSMQLSRNCDLKLKSQPFTDNQMELMRMISLGMSNKAISANRFTKEKSTENSIARLAKKMNIPSDNLRNQRVSIARFFFAINL